MNHYSHRHSFLWCITTAMFALYAFSATAQNNWGGYNNSNPYQGKLRGDDQKRFDDYYVKWIHDRERKDLGEVASMEARMLDVYAHNNIQSNVPYDLVASSNVALPTNGYQNWQGRLGGDDQQRFDSYYTRWLEYRSKKDKEQIASMQGREIGCQRCKPRFVEPAGARVHQKRRADLDDDAAEAVNGRKLAGHAP